MFSKGTKAQLFHRRTTVSAELQRHHEEVMEERRELQQLETYFQLEERLCESSTEGETVH
ncbi:MAG: hypothetical protein A3B31_03375 [Candidatus Komeilibacteria bacterium RIFCSPLOWO2_01_FULL_53_11]|uniref:Uncharacterized protein n=1 Tax=Candidatus Komeilibacteria bacterium RIFCSPLOWO2_01_FULL_53_11 TaxID=1798552 RepID=A0A1G2BUW7_9BACT|nr:MAG: hypothetical protein A3B31_03375 [Candidatus Komeilibacteria bacterium RIFCSPLOWO2_01_FULL_53_11]